jgi:hypothetical protein
MPPPPATLDHTPTPPRRGSFGVVLIYAALLTALLYLIFAQAGIDAPMRVSPNPAEYHADVAAQLVLADEDPHPAEMQFFLPDPKSETSVNAMGTTGIYYMSQYLRYPHRLLVGTDDRIINNEVQLLAAGKLPPVPWLKQHDVTAVYAVYAGFPPRLQVLKLR